VHELELIGGVLCLDFVNTVDPRHREARDEYLDSYAALVEWVAHAGAVSEPLAGRLRTAGEARPAQAERVRARAVSLREALYPLLAPAAAVARREDCLAVVTEELRQAYASAEVTRAGDAFALTFAGDGALDQVLWPVVRSAVELLLGADRRRVKECAGDRCGWLFVDRSKAGRRRWCSMASCGNRAKAQRHRDRARARAHASARGDN
jgi:predicted RNA-binding Zn ribbon-like protein